MSEQEKKQEKELPSVNKGVGGADRVAGFLSEEAAQDTRGTLNRLLRELADKKGLFILALLLTLLASLSQILTPRIIGRIINFIAKTFGSDVGLNWEGIRQATLILVGLYLVNFIATYVASRSMVSVTQGVVADLRLQMDRKLNKVPLNYFDNVSSGDLASLLSNDLDNVAHTLQSGLTSSITAVVIMVGVFVMMLSIHPLLAVLTLVVVPLSYYMVKYLIKKAKPIFQKNANYTGQLNGKITESFAGLDIVSAYHLEEKQIEEITALNEELYETEWKSSYVSFLTRPAGDLMLNINYVLVAIVGGYHVITGRLTLGEFQAFTQYVRMFNTPFRQVMGIMNTILGALASAERIYNFLDADEIQEFGSDILDTRQTQGKIVLKNVDFAYDTENPLFESVSLKVPAGKQFAIVGTTGAGKTTLVNLLMRFYEIQKGSIMLDGKDITTFKTDELRKAFAMVLQDTWLFEGTIRDNIAYGYPLEPGQTLDDVPQAEIEKAARMARAHHLIELTPDGYNTLLTDRGSNISQGQRQLITIARAMIKNAPITILDEATSSVDTRTELLIQEGMRELTDQKTSFVIAHRLSTIQNADMIIVMDQGTIVETGTHDDLLAENGLYAEMVHAGQAV